MTIYVDININKIEIFEIKETIGIKHISYKKCCDIILTYQIIIKCERSVDLIFTRTLSHIVSSKRHIHKKHVM